MIVVINLIFFFLKIHSFKEMENKMQHHFFSFFKAHFLWKKERERERERSRVVSDKDS